MSMKGGVKFNFHLFHIYSAVAQWNAKHALVLHRGQRSPDPGRSVRVYMPEWSWLHTIDQITVVWRAVTVRSASACGVQGADAAVLGRGPCVCMFSPPLMTRRITFCRLSTAVSQIQRSRARLVIHFFNLINESHWC